MYTRIVDDQPTTRVMAADGTGDRLLFDQPPKGCFRLSRPAGRPAVGWSSPATPEEAPRTVRLLVITLEGKIVRELDEGRLGDPTVTADGRWVLYWRNDEGSDEGGSLYRMRRRREGVAGADHQRRERRGRRPRGLPRRHPAGLQPRQRQRSEHPDCAVRREGAHRQRRAMDRERQQPGPVLVAGRAAHRVQARAQRRRPTSTCSTWRPGSPGARSRTPRRTPCRPGPPADAVRSADRGR